MDVSGDLHGLLESLESELRRGGVSVECCELFLKVSLSILNHSLGYLTFSRRLYPLKGNVQEIG